MLVVAQALLQLEAGLARAHLVALLVPALLALLVVGASNEGLADIRSGLTSAGALGIAGLEDPQMSMSDGQDVRMVKWTYGRVASCAEALVQLSRVEDLGADRVVSLVDGSLNAQNACCEDVSDVSRW